MKHGERSHRMSPGYPHAYITNRVHGGTWTSAPFQALSDQYRAEVAVRLCMLRYAIDMPKRKMTVGHGSPNVGEAQYACPPSGASTGEIRSAEARSRPPARGMARSYNWALSERVTAIATQKQTEPRSIQHCRALPRREPSGARGKPGLGAGGSAEAATMTG
jgi:hypothetical protein